MKLKIAGYSADNHREADPQSIDLKEIMLSADAKALRGLAEFFRRAAEEIETNGKNFNSMKFPEGDSNLPEFFVFNIDE
ncbi:MAG: hypothetical protein ACE1ZM_08995 [Gammaproteobacteria bacterium]